MTKRRIYVIGKKYYIIGTMTGKLTVYTCVNESNKYGFFTYNNGETIALIKRYLKLKPYTKAVQIFYEK